MGDRNAQRQAALAPRTYRVLELAVSDGVAMGWHSAHKDVESPDPAAIQEAIVRDVLMSVTEWFRVCDEED